MQSDEQQLSNEEIERYIIEINNMSHYNMCLLWREAPVGHIFFDKRFSLHEIFRKRLFDHFGGFTPEISKDIGW